MYLSLFMLIGKNIESINTNPGKTWVFIIPPVSVIQSASMQKNFDHIPEIAEGDHSLSGFHPLLTRLLLNRGIRTQADAELFLKPKYEEHMHDPLLMHDMEKAVVRIFESIEAKEKIVVYADYDCDGIPGAVILHDLLTKIGYEHFSVYIPDRHEEGYGLNKDAIETFIEQEVQLLITIDLGTTDHEDIAEAQANGIDVIVTDHHLPHETLPSAFAIVNPKLGASRVSDRVLNDTTRSDSAESSTRHDSAESYPEPMLCGSGVMFKLVQAFVKKYGEYYKINEGWEKWLLDMAGLATLSDMVPLVGENRTIASFGMQVFRKSPRPGLQQLLRKLNIDQTTIVEDDITFMVTPRINAASRMDSPMRAFEMLSERDPVKAGALAEHLTKINDERKTLVAGIMKEVKHALAERTLGPIIVIGNPKWRVGILGLVAGKVMDEFDRPVFVWGREGTNGDTVVKGSCRSNGAVNVVQLMETAKEHFIDFGGHELAGGFSVTQDSVHFLEEKLCALFASMEKGVALASLIDATLTLSDINEKTCTLITQLAPFGLGNPKPTFLFPGVQIKKIKSFGKEKNHLELTLGDSTASEKVAIAFFCSEDSFSKKVVMGENVDLIATIEKSYFAGRTTIRLRIVDIQ